MATQGRFLDVDAEQVLVVDWVESSTDASPAGELLGHHLYTRPSQRASWRLAARSDEVGASPLVLGPVVRVGATDQALYCFEERRAAASCQGSDASDCGAVSCGVLGKGTNPHVVTLRAMVLVDSLASPPCSVLARDVDGDGKTDFLVEHSDGRQYVFQNSGESMHRVDIEDQPEAASARAR